MSCWPVAMLAAIVPCVAFAACAPKLPFCQTRPSRTDSTVTIFVGKVKTVTTPATGPSDPRAFEDVFLSGRNVYRQNRAPSLSDSAKQYPVVTFEVLENFIGATTAEFTVRSTSDVFINNIPQSVPAFSQGEAWLVEAYYDPQQQQWFTSTCHRTKPVSQANDDLQALRTWVVGGRLPGRVQGQVANPDSGKYMSGVQVYLRGPRQSLSTTTDSRGEFSFNDLEPGVYETTTIGARSISVNLTDAWCSYVVFIVK